jgi:hypothetical protein
VVNYGQVDYGPRGHSQLRGFQTCGRQSATSFQTTLPTVATWTIICMANVSRGFGPRGPRDLYTWPTYRGVATIPRGPVTMWTAWPRCELHVSQQSDLPHHPHVANDTWRTVCHVDGPHTHGKLQVANCKFFCSVIVSHVFSYLLHFFTI